MSGASLPVLSVSQLVGVLIALPAVIVGRSLLGWGNASVAARAAATVKTSLRERLVAQL